MINYLSRKAKLLLNTSAILGLVAFIGLILYMLTQTVASTNCGDCSYYNPIFSILPIPFLLFVFLILPLVSKMMYSHGYNFRSAMLSLLTILLCFYVLAVVSREDAQLLIFLFSRI